MQDSFLLLPPPQASQSLLAPPPACPASPCVGHLSVRFPLPTRLSPCRFPSRAAGGACSPLQVLTSRLCFDTGCHAVSPVVQGPGLPLAPRCRHMVGAHWTSKWTYERLDTRFPPLCWTSPDTGAACPCWHAPPAEPRRAHSRASPHVKGACLDTIGPSDAVTAPQPAPHPQVELGWTGQLGAAWLLAAFGPWDTLVGDGERASWRR